jgi:hypothetical protein
VVAVGPVVVAAVLRLAPTPGVLAGIQYSFGRVPMGACDFSTNPEWSYDDVKGDVTLQNFTLVRVWVFWAWILPVLGDVYHAQRPSACNVTVKLGVCSPTTWRCAFL